jgi:hypothetical protein
MKPLAALMLFLAVSTTTTTTTVVMAFAPTTTTLRSTTTTTTTKLSSPFFTTLQVPLSTTTTSLSERNPYNYNEGQSPWGLKTNGEIWNGRVAMVRFNRFEFDDNDSLVGQNPKLEAQTVGNTACGQEDLQNKQTKDKKSVECLVSGRARFGLCIYISPLIIFSSCFVFSFPSRVCVCVCVCVLFPKMGGRLSSCLSPLQNLSIIVDTVIRHYIITAIYPLDFDLVWSIHLSMDQSIHEIIDGLHLDLSSRINYR